MLTNVRLQYNGIYRPAANYQVVNENELIITPLSTAAETVPGNVGRLGGRRVSERESKTETLALTSRLDFSELRPDSVLL
jgi:hypothetical protein